MPKAVSVGVALAVVIAGAGLTTSPANAASSDQWRVVAYFSKPAWKTSKPKAQVLKACRTGTGGSPFKIGTPVQVRDDADQVLGDSSVTEVKLWKEGGRYICKFYANVPVASSPSDLVFVQVATTGSLLTSVSQVEADGWEVAFWPH